MTKPNQSSRTGAVRWLIAGAVALGISAAPLVITYAAPGDPTGTPDPNVTTNTTTTANPAVTAAPSTTTSKPTATAAPVVVAPPVLAATYDTRPFTCDTGLCDHSNITVYVPNVPDTAWIGVQWFDSTAKAWKNVDGWQGDFDIAPNTGQPFKQWTVFKTNFGQGPFRWMILNAPNGSVIGLSPEFNLPAIGGLNVLTFLATPPMAQAPVTTNQTSLVNAPMLTANSSISPFSCESPCEAGNIALYVPNAPSNAWVGVQWLDSNGIWHDVPGWQGNLDITSTNTTPFKQWSFAHSQFGQGPYHYVIYTQKDGSVWGVSPNFNLPKNGGEILTTFLSPAG